MKKTAVLLGLLIQILNVYSQEFKTITNVEHGYKITIPSNWNENKLFYSKNLSLTQIDTVNTKKEKAYRGITIQHKKTEKESLKEAYKEHIEFLQSFYGKRFTIIHQFNHVVKGEKTKCFVEHHQSPLSGKKGMSYQLFYYNNKKTTIITLNVKKQNLEKDLEFCSKIVSSLNFLSNENTISFDELINKLIKVDNLNEFYELKKKSLNHSLIKSKYLMDDSNGLKRKINEMKINDYFYPSEKDYFIKVIDKLKVKCFKIELVTIETSNKSREIILNILRKSKKGKSLKELSKLHPETIHMDLRWIKENSDFEKYDSIIFSKKKDELFILNHESLGECIVLKKEEDQFIDEATVILAQKKKQ